MPERFDFAYTVEPPSDAWVRPTEHEIHIVRDRLLAWSELYRLTIPGLVEATATYVQYCFTPVPSRAALELATDYVAWVLAFNDLPSSPHKAGILRSALAALRHGAGDEGVPHVKATLDLRQAALSHWPGRTERLLARLGALLECSIWEIEVGEPSLQAGSVPSAADYLHHRQHTIAHNPFMEMWRLEANVDPVSALWPAVERLEELDTAIIYLTNDIVSVARDIRKNKLNLVFFLAREHHVSLERAAEMTVQKLRQAAAELGALSARVTVSDLSDSRVEGYVRFLISAVEGNRAAILSLKARYRQSIPG